MTLSEFLLARIAEDEDQAHGAERVGRPPWYGKQVEYEWSNGRGESGVKSEQCVVWNNTGQSVMRTASGFDAVVGYHIARWDPARVLAECEAKRQLVADHNAEVAIEDDGQEFWTDCESCRQSPPCTTLRILGTVFADHPDYDEAWRP